MFRNYLKVAWRNLWKSKVYTSLNIIGLATGMAAFIVIMLFVRYERSFDKFHTKNIYRLNEVQKFPGMVSSQKVGLSMFPMGPTLKNEFPEIKNFTRVSWRTKYPLTYQEKRVYFPQLFFVDTTFLQLFDFKLITGNRETALQQPNSIVLTQSGAEKLFGKENPIGKRVTHFGGDTTHFVVTGILANVPENSQLQFEGLMSFNTIYKPNWMDGWGGNWLDTYFELAANTNLPALEKKFPAYLKKHLSEDNWKYYELFLLPLADVHANASDIGLDYVNYQKFDRKYTNIFSGIALIVLVIACVNFMNLATARSAERAKEVGVRKSIGAQRFQLGTQFISETVLLSFFALLLAIILVLVSLPYINHLSQKNLHFPVLSDPWLLISLILGTLTVGLLSGIYPAVYLSSFQPIKVLKGSFETGKNKGMLRNILVVGQFTSAIFLMIATVFVVRQLGFMQDRDPGFNRDQVLTMPISGMSYNKYELLKDQLSANSLVAGVTAAQDQLGSHLDQSGVHFVGKGPRKDFATTRLIVDNNYLNLYHLQLVEGRNFSPERSMNGKEYIINETLARELLKDEHNAPFSTLLGKEFGFDSLGTIVGIAKDFNFNSLQYKIETMFLFSQKDWGYNTISVKINGGKTKEAIAYIQATWQKLFPDQPFEYQFLDQHFGEVYQSDTQVSKMVGILATLAIIISCLGLFGLASYSAEKRVKEIGIRKVLGASIRSIVSLLSIHFVKLVLIANLIAWPLAWYVLSRWLENYAYHIPINGWIFLLTGVLAMGIALATVSFHAARAALANPVQSLRSE